MTYKGAELPREDIQKCLVRAFRAAGPGRSGGYRTIVLYRRAERAFFVFGFAKSGRDNIADDEEEQFRRMAGYVLALTDAHLAALVEAGQFVEIEGYDDEEV